MTQRTKTISKEIYERARHNHGCITKEDESKVFDSATLCGYGLYGTAVYEDAGKYYCRYMMGDSCD